MLFLFEKAHNRVPQPVDVSKTVQNKGGERICRKLIKTDPMVKDRESTEQENYAIPLLPELLHFTPGGVSAEITGLTGVIGPAQVAPDGSSEIEAVDV